MKLTTFIDKALEFSFGFGAIWFLAFFTLAIFVPGIPLLWGIPAIFMMIVPQSLWFCKVRPDPFDKP